MRPRFVAMALALVLGSTAVSGNTDPDSARPSQQKPDNIPPGFESLFEDQESLVASAATAAS